MPFCTNCRYEYKDGTTLCPDCNMPLVAELTPKTAATSPDQSWVAICDVMNDLSSSRARGALESRNIPSIVMSSTFKAYGVGDQYTAQLVGSPRATNVIMVPREFADEASVILEAVLGDDYNQSEAR